MTWEDTIAKKDDNAIRFSVGTSNLHASVWILFVKRNDVFLAARRYAGEAKISFHESGDWRYAYTKFLPQMTANKDRILHIWRRPPEYFPGTRLAFDIAVPNSELCPPRKPLKKPQKIVWVTPSKTTEVTDVGIILVDNLADYAVDSWPGRDATDAPTGLVGRLPLLNGGGVFVVANDIEMNTNIEKAISHSREFRIGVHDDTTIPDAEIHFFGGSSTGPCWMIDTAAVDEIFVRDVESAAE